VSEAPAPGGAPAPGQAAWPFAFGEGRRVLGAGRPMEDLAMHILDIARNAAEAGATRVEIRVDEDTAANVLRIEVADNGRGMDEATARLAADSCFTTRETRAGGLGLPLLRQAAEAAGGSMRVASAPGAGTLGDLDTTVLVLLASHPDLDLDWTHRRGARTYSLSSRDLRAALDGAPLASPGGIALVRAAVRQGEAGLVAPAAGARRTEDQR